MTRGRAIAARMDTPPLLAMSCLPGLGARSRRAGSTFCQLLRAGQEDYRVDEEALAYRQAQKLPHGPLERLRTHSDGLFSDEALLNAHLTRLEITQERHRRTATEGALLGSVLHHGFPKELPS